MTYLQIDYRAEGWGLRLLGALNRTNLPIATRWREDVLSDLAFSINTRIGLVRSIVEAVDMDLSILALELRDRPPKPEMLVAHDPVSYTFRERGVVRRCIALLVAFGVEAEGLFDNLVEFYRRLTEALGSPRVSARDAENFVKAVSSVPEWHTKLNAFRNQAVHRFAPWLAFQRSADGAQWEPLLVHDWRPEALNARTATPLGTLRDVLRAISEAAIGVEDRLVAMIASPESSP